MSHGVVHWDNIATKQPEPSKKSGGRDGSLKSGGRDGSLLHARKTQVPSTQQLHCMRTSTRGFREGMHTACEFDT